MKALKAGAVMLLGMALSVPVWGHSDSEWFAFENPNPGPVMHPDARPFEPDEGLIEVSRIGGPHSLRVRVRVLARPRNCGRIYGCVLEYWQAGIGWAVRTMGPGDSEVWDMSLERHRPAWWNDFTGPYDAEFVFGIVRYRAGPSRTGTHSIRYIDAHRHVHYRTPSAPETEPETPSEPEPPDPEPPAPPEPEPPSPPEPDPEPPAPPPEPEPPEPETPSEPEPEPEVPDPEEPDHTHPVERCDHIAIVPAMPRALSGDEGSPDHWLRISNLGAASITFAITGLDEGGTKAGTYRRELPASRIVRVKMRDVEAAFDVEPEGWWRLVVTGSGPLEVVATMRQGAERRFVPVRTPATCTSGPVTRTGG